MKKNILIALLIAAPLLAAPPDGRRISITILTDDDDGRVEAYRRGDIIAGPAGAASIRDPQFHLLFIGSWNPSARDAVASQIAHVSMPDGVKPAAIAGSRDIGARATLNDLQIQEAIDSAMRDGTLPSRDPNTVYIVLLGPGVKSTLGAAHAGAEYDSYHSHFNAHETNVRYVVVPWNDDAAVMHDAAANSALRAVVNPDGN